MDFVAGIFLILMGFIWNLMITYRDFYMISMGLKENGLSMGFLYGIDVGLTLSVIFQWEIDDDVIGSTVKKRGLTKNEWYLT